MATCNECHTSYDSHTLPHHFKSVMQARGFATNCPVCASLAYEQIVQHDQMVIDEHGARAKEERQMADLFKKQADAYETRLRQMADDLNEFLDENEPADL